MLREFWNIWLHEFYKGDLVDAISAAVFFGGGLAYFTICMIGGSMTPVRIRSTDPQ